MGELFWNTCYPMSPDTELAVLNKKLKGSVIFAEICYSSSVSDNEWKATLANFGPTYPVLRYAPREKGTNRASRQGL